MWRQFALAVAVVLILCYVPGYLFSRAIGTKRITSLVVAPLISVCLIGFSGIAIYPLGLRGVTPLLGGVGLFILIAAGLSYLIQKIRPIQENQSHVNLGEKDSLNGVFLLVTAAISTAIFFVIFHKAIRNPSWFLQSADNYAHLAYITRSVQSGIYSMLHAAFYTGARPELQTPFFDEGFYPTSFHSLAAVTAAITGFNEVLTENVVWFVFVAVIYPVGVCALLQVIGKKNVTFSLLTAFAAFAQLAFPIRMVTVHAVFPNVAGFCLVPTVAAVFILSFNEKTSCKEVCSSTHSVQKFSVNIHTLCLCFMGIIALALVHPSADFLWAIFVLPFVLCNLLPSFAQYLSKKFELTKPKKIILLICLECVILGSAIGMWNIVLNSSFMAPTVNFLWEIYVDPIQSVLSVLNFGLLLNLPQILFAVAFWIGFVSCCMNKKCRWLTLVFLMTAVIYVASLSDVIPIKRFFSGFWYTDPERTAAMIVFTAIPIVAAGVYIIAMGVGFLVNKTIIFVKKKKNPKLSQEGTLQLHLVYTSRDTTDDQQESRIIKISQITVQVCVFCFIALAYGAALLTPWDLSKLPSHVKSELRCAITWMNEAYAPRRNMPYSVSEDNFVKKAQRVVGSDSLVINNPYDGSLTIGAVRDMRVYYRAKAEGEETPQSWLIRTKLNQISNDQEVQKAVKDIGAHYVILLDTDNPALLGDQKEVFPGLQITDNTPGFEVVLAEGPYRLYRITAID